MTRVKLLWIIGAVITIGAVFAVNAVIFVTSVSIGVASAVTACGIDLSVLSGQPKAAALPTLTATPTPTQSGDPTPSPSETPGEVGEFGEAAKAYFAQFSPSQQEYMKKHIALIVSIGKSRVESDGFTQHVVQAALGVAQKESNFKNYLVAEDHDSLGIYQQRPSAIVWGTAEQIVDPVHAINAFYDGVVRNIPSLEERERLPLVEFGIAVQNPNRGFYRSGWIRDNIDAVSADLLKAYWSSDGSGDICISAAGVATGEWQLPLAPDSYCTTYGFGPRSGGQHNGVDMACNAGDPIYAVADGIVGVAGPDGGYGTHVTIDHGGGIVSGYGHMVSGSIPVGVVPGVQVRRGQVIGYVGTTGRSFGEHLHFEILINGEYADPTPFMAQKGVVL